MVHAHVRPSCIPTQQHPCNMQIQANAERASCRALRKLLYPGRTAGNAAGRYLACTRGNRGISTTGVRASSAQANATQCAGPHATLHAHHRLPAWPVYLSRSLTLASSQLCSHLQGHQPELRLLLPIRSSEASPVRILLLHVSQRWQADLFSCRVSGQARIRAVSFHWSWRILSKPNCAIIALATYSENDTKCINELLLLLRTIYCV